MGKLRRGQDYIHSHWSRKMFINISAGSTLWKRVSNFEIELSKVYTYPYRKKEERNEKKEVYLWCLENQSIYAKKEFSSCRIYLHPEWTMIDRWIDSRSDENLRSFFRYRAESANPFKSICVSMCAFILYMYIHDIPQVMQLLHLCIVVSFLCRTILQDFNVDTSNLYYLLKKTSISL